MTNTAPTQTRADHDLDVQPRDAPTGMSAIEGFGIAGLSATVAIHTTELSGKIEETTYLGVGYLALIAASIVSIVLIARRDVAGWVLGGLTSAATIVGFVLTRTTGLPGAHGDVGNWGETLAIWSLLAEALVVVLAAMVIFDQRSTAGVNT